VDDDRCTYEEMAPSEAERDAARASLDALDKARTTFRDAALAAAKAIYEAKAEYLSLWCVGTRKSDQSPSEIIEGFADLAAEIFDDIVDQDHVEQDKNMAEGGE